MGAATDGQARLMAAEVFDRDLDDLTVHLDPPNCGPEPPRAKTVGVPVMAQLDQATDVDGHLRTTASRPAEEAGRLDVVGGVGQVDGRLHQREVGEGRRQEAVCRLLAVEPTGVERTGRQLGTAEQVEQEALIGGSLANHHGRPGQRPLQPGQRLLAIGAPREHLGDHRVEGRRDDIALGDAGIDPDAGAGRETQQLDDAGRGQEPACRVLGIEASFDGVAVNGGGLTLQPAPAGDVQLELHEVEPGRHLGHRVLDLEPGVDLHERERARGGVVEELDRPGPAVAGREHQAGGCLTDRSFLVVVEDGRRRLLDHLLVAALQAAVAHADRPGRAGTVGDHLHLDVAGRGDQPLEEHGGVAERGRRLGTRRGEGLGQVLGPVDTADAAAPATRGGLHHERVADRRRVLLGLGDRGHGTTAPRCDRHAGLFGQLLGRDLVADPAHRGCVGPHEGDAQPFAQLHEAGLLGDESPPHPHGVGPGLHQGPLEQPEVEVAGAGGTQQHRFIGLTNEHRPSLDIGVQGDDRQRRMALRVALARRVDAAHRRLAPVHDGEPTEQRWHAGSALPVLGGQWIIAASHGNVGHSTIAARSGASRSSPSAPGRAVVR